MTIRRYLNKYRFLINVQLQFKFPHKNYQKNIRSIPDLLGLKFDTDERHLLQELCIFSVLAMKEQKSVDLCTLKKLCIKSKELILQTVCLKSLDFFISWEYAFSLKEFSKAIDKTWVNDTVTKILDWTQVWSRERASLDVMTIKKFIMVVVEFEAIIGRCSPAFPMSAKVIEYFQNNMLSRPQRESGWPTLLLKTLETCRLAKDDDHTGIELLDEVSKLVSEKNKYRQDIAIMITQIIAASISVVSRSVSIQFLHNMFLILGTSYDIIRDKTVSSSTYRFKSSYQITCCEKWEKHSALKMLQTVRKIFLIAMERGNFDEALVSSCVNFILAEANGLEHLVCENRQNLLRQVNNAAVEITNNIHKIIDVCGNERGVRTIKKFLSIQTIYKYLSHYNMITALIKICSNVSTTEKIDLFAVRVVCAPKNNKVHCIHQLHLLQSKEDASKFRTISTILGQLSKKDYGMISEFDPLKISFLQLRVEIEYPSLNKSCREKLIADFLGMDSYKNNSFAYVNLIKENVAVLQCMIDIEHYKSKVTLRDYHQPFNEDVQTLNYERDLIKKLQGALDCFSSFLRDKDLWVIDQEKDEYISNMEMMLQKIGHWLMTRQYKELAIIAFDLLHRVAKLSDNSLKQIIAAGYIVENISLHPKASIVEEIVADLQNNILKKFKEVDAMSQQDHSNFLMAFLQLTMHTLRCNNNMEHAKKYMQAINKLLDKYDSEKQKYTALRLKYSELMFEMIIMDSSASVTPITFVEDVFHRFKNIHCTSQVDVAILPGILFDIVNTLYAYTHARFEFHHTSSLIRTLLNVCIRGGYIFLLAKVVILMTSEYLHTNGKHWEDHLSQLDVIFECKESNEQNDLTALEVQSGSTAPAVQSSSSVSKVIWNKEVTPYIHSTSCDCFQCCQKCINLVKMEVATLKASASYYIKDYERSLQSFQRVYGHWTNSSDTPYISMLMNYSNCLISKNRIKDSKELLSKARSLCRNSDSTHYAQAQDITLRLFYIQIRDEMEIDVIPSYANDDAEYDAIVAARKAASVRKKTVSQSAPRVLRPQRTTKVSKTTKRNIYN